LNSKHLKYRMYDVDVSFFVCLIQSGASPLMIASQYGMLEVVRALLRFHARVDVFDEVTEGHLATKTYTEFVSCTIF